MDSSKKGEYIYDDHVLPGYNEATAMCSSGFETQNLK